MPARGSWRDRFGAGDRRLILGRARRTWPKLARILYPKGQGAGDRQKAQAIDVIADAIAGAVEKDRAG